MWRGIRLCCSSAWPNLQPRLSTNARLPPISLWSVIFLTSAALNFKSFLFVALTLFCKALFLLMFGTFRLDGTA
jgi:uncharacterized membrane protein